MKHKLSVTLDEELVSKIFQALSSGKFRNKSHVVEYAVQKLLANEKTNQNPNSNLSNKSIVSQKIVPKELALLQNSRGDLDGR